MSEGRVPAWLADFQRAFGAVLRAPLDRRSGELRAVPSAYDAAVVAGVAGDGAARLAVYNRQYWFRLFGVMQEELPLVTALVGPWAFNGLAQRFLLAHPPADRDIARVADGFDVFLEARAPAAGGMPDGLSDVVSGGLSRVVPDSLSGVVPDGGVGPLPRAALVQAARVDEAFRRVRWAPEEGAFRPAPADAGRLARCRLVPSRALSIVDEDWPLFELRHRLPRGPGPRAWELPPPHAGGRRSWAVCRAPGGHRVLPLDRRRAALLRHLCARPVGEALALLEEAESPRQPPEQLARDVRRWLAESVDLGFWTALEDPAAPA